jgi:hypothetical protein
MNAVPLDAVPEEYDQLMHQSVIIPALIPQSVVPQSAIVDENSFVVPKPKRKVRLTSKCICCNLFKHEERPITCELMLKGYDVNHKWTNAITRKHGETHFQACQRHWKAAQPAQPNNSQT